MTATSPNQDLIVRVESLIRRDTYTVPMVFDMIAQYAPQSAGIAYAIASHARDIFVEKADDDTWTVTDTVVELYRRTFFDVTHAEKYGTQNLAGNRRNAESFVAFLETQYDIADHGYANVTPITAARH